MQRNKCVYWIKPLTCPWHVLSVRLLIYNSFTSQSDHTWQLQQHIKKWNSQCSEQQSWMSHCFHYNKLTFNYTCDLHFVTNHIYKVLILTVFCVKHSDLCNYTTFIDLKWSHLRMTAWFKHVIHVLMGLFSRCIYYCCVWRSTYFANTLCFDLYVPRSR